MTNYWRKVGLSYLQYSNICAKVVRRALKANLREEAAHRDISYIKFTHWKDGKPVLTKEGATGERK